jgi:hypothetical protein
MRKVIYTRRAKALAASPGAVDGSEGIIYHLLLHNRLQRVAPSPTVFAISDSDWPGGVWVMARPFLGAVGAVISSQAKDYQAGTQRRFPGRLLKMVCGRAGLLSGSLAYEPRQS